MAEILKTINGEILKSVNTTSDIKTFDGQVFTILGIPTKIIVPAAAAEGYEHTVMGVASANISTVIGVATANVSKVSGV